MNRSLAGLRPVEIERNGHSTTFVDLKVAVRLTEITRNLIEVARRKDPDIRIFAFTLPEKGERQDEDGRDVRDESCWPLPSKLTAALRDRNPAFTP